MKNVRKLVKAMCEEYNLRQYTIARCRKIITIHTNDNYNIDAEYELWEHETAVIDTIKKYLEIICDDNNIKLEYYLKESFVSGYTCKVLQIVPKYN